MKCTLIIILLILVGCSTSSNNFFKGDFTSLKNCENIVNFKTEEFDFSMIGIDKFVIVDTFIITQNSSNSDFLMSIYGLNSKTHIANIIGRGHGRDEYLSINITDDYIVKNGEVKLWIVPNIDNELILLDISKSVTNNLLTIEKKYNLKNKKIGQIISWDLKKANDSILYGVKVRKSIPSFIHYDYSKDTILSEIDLTNNNMNGDISLLSGTTIISDDETKFVNMMLYFDQLNLYDYQSKKGESFSLKKSPIDYFTLLGSQNERHCYYSDIALIDDFIIIAYSSNAKNNYCDQLHIYNWNGVLVNILKVNEPFLYSKIDKIKKDIYLYGIEEKVYKGNIAQFIQ